LKQENERQLIKFEKDLLNENKKSKKVEISELNDKIEQLSFKLESKTSNKNNISNTSNNTNYDNNDLFKMNQPSTVFDLTDSNDSLLCSLPPSTSFKKKKNKNRKSSLSLPSIPNSLNNNYSNNNSFITEDLDIFGSEI
jgi:hypothetical protein